MATRRTWDGASARRVAETEVDRPRHASLTCGHDRLRRAPASRRSRAEPGAESRGGGRAARCALVLEPRSVKAHFKLGIALERQRKWGEAERAFREAIRRQARSRAGLAAPCGDAAAGRARTRRRRSPSGRRCAWRRPTRRRVTTWPSRSRVSASSTRRVTAYRRGDRGGAQQSSAPRRPRHGAHGPAPVRRRPRRRFARRSACSRARCAPACISATRSDGSRKWTEAAQAYREALELAPRDADLHGSLGADPRADEAATERRPRRTRGRSGSIRPTASGSVASAWSWSDRESIPKPRRRSARRRRTGPICWTRTSGSPPSRVGKGKWGEEAKAYTERDPAQAWRSRSYAPTSGSRSKPRVCSTEATQAFRDALALGARQLPICTSISGSRSAARAATSRPRQRCREAIRLNPEDVVALANLAVSLGRQGRPAQSEAAYREAIRCRPGGAALHRGLGMALYFQGKYAAAEESLREAFRLKPTYARARADLGEIVSEQGRHAEAVEIVSRSHRRQAASGGLPPPSRRRARRPGTVGGGRSGVSGKRSG